MKKIKHKNYAMMRVESENNVEIEELLRQKFVDENKTIEKISNELQISYVTTIKWLKLSGIYSRMLNI